MARKEEPTLITDTGDIEDDTLAAMINAREILANEQKILALRQESLRKRKDKIVKELQAYCPHAVTEETSSYFSGSYDEVARTFYRETCNHCGLTIRTWDKAHGYYG
jgi:hypothetical protein